MGVYTDKNFPGSEPFKDSNDYPVLEGIDYKKLVLTSDGMSDEQRTFALNQFEKYIITQKGKFLGYQANQKLDYSGDLSRFMDSHINNIGDPFQSGNFTVNSKIIERAVLDYFASLWHAKWPHLEKDVSVDGWKKTYWGYVLSMGSSEGNIYALWNARDYLSGKFLLKDTEKAEKARKSSKDGMVHKAAPHFKRFSAKAEKDNIHAYTPIAFYSENTHYSIVKNMRILGITTFYDEAVKKGYDCPLKLETEDYPDNFSYQYIGENDWPYEVPSNEDGSIYIPALTKLVEFFAKQGYPPMLIFNYGSTFKGALDNVEEAVNSLRDILKENNLYKRKIQYGKDKEDNPLFDIRTGFWVHVDGALGAGYAPYLKKQDENTAPIFDFRIKELHSITMSGHKWIGAPWPCGVFMTKGKYQLLPVDNPAYIGSSDTTFSGSRNGFSSLILWDFISKHSLDELAARAEKAIEMAEFFKEEFKKVEEKYAPKDLWLEHSPNAITVRFRKLNQSLIYKYSLSSESLYVNGEQRDYNHIFLMDHVEKDLLREFVNDLLNSENPFAEEKPSIPDMALGEIVMGFGLGFK